MPMPTESSTNQSVPSPRHSEGAERAQPALSIAGGNLVVAIED